jgi:hypothetical protein
MCFGERLKTVGALKRGLYGHIHATNDTTFAGWRHYVGRSEKQFWNIFLSLPPDPIHHCDHLALCVEPRMHSIAGALQGRPAKPPDFVVSFQGIHPAKKGEAFDLRNARFVQPFEFKRFALAAIFRYSQTAVTPKLTSMGKTMWCLNNSIE